MEYLSYIMIGYILGVISGFVLLAKGVLWKIEDGSWRLLDRDGNEPYK